MKVVLFILHILYFIFLAAVPAVAARLPIIIDSATLSHPLDDKDQNYLPSDPEQVDTVKHVKTVTIQETFNPITTGTDSNGQPIYQSLTVDKIDDTLNLDQYTNNGLNYYNAHMAKRFTNPLADSATIQQEFLSYNSSNLARRSLPAHLQKCLIGQRMVSAYRTLAGDFTGTTVDSIISKSPKMRISQVAFYFRNQAIFYDPAKPCPATAQDGLPLSAFVPSLPLVSTPHSLSDYQKAYQFAIEPIDDNSLGMVVEQCDLTNSGQAINCKKEIRSLPQGAGPASVGGQSTIKYLIPASAKIVDRNYDQTVSGTAIPDRPNPISFFAQYFKQFFSGVLTESKTFKGPTQLTHQIDSRLEEGLRIDETASRYLLPASANEQIKPASSTTNGSTLDPGKANADLRLQLKKWLYPSSWQPN